jgi:hypothetical protein
MDFLSWALLVKLGTEFNGRRSASRVSDSSPASAVLQARKDDRFLIRDLEYTKYRSSISIARLRTQQAMYAFLNEKESAALDRRPRVNMLSISTPEGAFKRH